MCGALVTSSLTTVAQGPQAAGKLREVKRVPAEHVPTDGVRLPARTVSAPCGSCATPRAPRSNSERAGQLVRHPAGPGPDEVKLRSLPRGTGVRRGSRGWSAVREEEGEAGGCGAVLVGGCGRLTAPGTGAKAKPTPADRILATVLHLRKLATMDLIGQLSDCGVRSAVEEQNPRVDLGTSDVAKVLVESSWRLNKKGVGPNERDVPTDHEDTCIRVVGDGSLCSRGETIGLTREVVPAGRLHNLGRDVVSVGGPHTVRQLEVGAPEF